MSASSRKVIFAALVGNGLIAVTKFIAALVSGSSAMFSEAIHSVVDTGNQLLLLHGLRRSRKPPDERFPFGHGKEVYFWSFVVAILIFAVGAGISVYEGVHRLVDPHPISNPAVNYVVLGLAMLFESFAWYFAFTEFSRAKGRWGYIEAVQRGKDPSLFVVLFEDSAAMLGLLAAFVGVLLSDLGGFLRADGAASIVIGVILGGTAIWLAWETKGLLIGESANPRVVRGIRETVLDSPEVRAVQEVLTMHMGPEFVLANIAVRFRGDASAPEIEAAIDRIDARLKARFPEIRRVFVEAGLRKQAGEPDGRPV